MTELTISTMAIVLLIVPFLVHGIEVLWPMQSRWVVNWVLPFFAPMLPSRGRAILRAEQIVMLDAALDAAPADKKRAAQDYVFLLLFEQRQGAICFTAVAGGALYGLTLGLPDRDALHFVFGSIAVLMMLANANQAGMPGFGNHPKVSRNGKHVGFVFTPFWVIATALNVLGFSYAVA
ncbi:hypothetical protein N9801_00875 [Yoonia sp.]|uniref:hypothetical protein n=1 Tax=Yoonia sp. TaxID=2212373 RepID=UPI0023315607|nr:hypothetical protein [Yoonia sp.]MDB4240807.1 hypothetical protein [Yoonia sp.]